MYSLSSYLLRDSHVWGRKGSLRSNKGEPWVYMKWYKIACKANRTTIQYDNQFPKAHLERAICQSFISYLIVCSLRIISDTVHNTINGNWLIYKCREYLITSSGHCPVQTVISPHQGSHRDWSFQIIVSTFLCSDSTACVLPSH